MLTREELERRIVATRVAILEAVDTHGQLTSMQMRHLTDGIVPDTSRYFVSALDQLAGGAKMLVEEREGPIRRFRITAAGKAYLEEHKELLRATKGAKH